MSEHNPRAHPHTHRDRQIKEVVHDPYQERHKPAGPACCPDCGAIFQQGRWTWGERPHDAQYHECPACRRIKDRFPAGYVTLRGEYLTQRLDEFQALIRHQEAQARAEHPLERIMDMEVKEGALVVTTTDLHLAQRIGNAVHAAHQGLLQIKHSPDDYQVRIDWER